MAQRHYSAVTVVDSSATSVTIIMPRQARVGVSILNDSASKLYVRLGDDDAATDDYSQDVDPGDTYEVYPKEYNGKITGIWASADGQARITEVW